MAAGAYQLPHRDAVASETRSHPGNEALRWQSRARLAMMAAPIVHIRLSPTIPAEGAPMQVLLAAVASHVILLPGAAIVSPRTHRPIRQANSQVLA
jgi:hypothetical protein